MNAKTRSVLGAGVVTVLLAAPAGAAAEERTCTGSIGAQTVDNLRVPEGATCTLNATNVKGTAKVERAATLRAAGIRVVGNVQAENAADVVLAGSTIGGSVQVKQGGGADVVDSAITGDVQYDANSGRLNVTRNRVNGNVQVVGNRGQALVFDNTIDANLQCKENSPPPRGANNAVKGSAEDQCSAFAGGAGAPAGSVGNSSTTTSSSAGGSATRGDDDAPHGALTTAQARRAVIGLTVRRRAGRLVLFGRAFVPGRSLAGLRVTVQARRAGRWRDLKSTRTARDGRYRTSVIARRDRRVLRVIVKRQAGMPLARTSQTRIIR